MTSFHWIGLEQTDKLPQVVLIDGGKPQLNAALRVKTETPLARDIKIVALAKRHNELFVEGKRTPLLLKDLPRPVFDTILQLRDEAHRSARRYHFLLRQKRFFGRELTPHQKPVKMKK